MTYELHSAAINVHVVLHLRGTMLQRYNLRHGVWVSAGPGQQRGNSPAVDHGLVRGHAAHDPLRENMNITVICAALVRYTPAGA